MSWQNADLKTIEEGVQATLQSWRNNFLSNGQDRLRKIHSNVSGNTITTLDLELGTILKQNLESLSPWKAFTEESLSETSEVQDEYYWLIDPVDGTKEFLKGIPECATSIALIDSFKMRSVWGMVFDIYGGNFYSSLKQRKKTILTDSKVDLLFSRSEQKLGLEPKLAGLVDSVKQITPMGSVVYKLIKVYLEQDSVATISLQPKHTWDLAGMAAFFNESDVALSDLSGKPLRFGSCVFRKFNGVVAVKTNFYRQWINVLHKADVLDIGDLRTK